MEKIKNPEEIYRKHSFFLTIFLQYSSNISPYLIQSKFLTKNKKIFTAYALTISLYNKKIKSN